GQAVLLASRLIASRKVSAENMTSGHWTDASRPSLYSIPHARESPPVAGPVTWAGSHPAKRRRGSRASGTHLRTLTGRPATAVAIRAASSAYDMRSPRVEGSGLSFGAAIPFRQG